MTFDKIPPLGPSERNSDPFSEERLGNKPETFKIAAGTQDAAPPGDCTVIAPGQGGLIKDIKLPGKWTKVQREPDDEGIPGFRVDLYSFDGAKDVYMTYKYRGGDPYITADAINRTMKLPDHKMVDPAEIKAVTRGLNDNEQGLAEYFDLKKAWTQTINGQKVLFVEGTHKQDPAKGMHALTAYLDSDPARPGRLPESVTYWVDGDQSKFDTYRSVAEAAFRSMEYKAHVDTSKPR